MLLRTAARRSVGMATRLVSTEARLAELGHELPPASTPKGSYVTVTRSGNLLFTGAAIFSHCSGNTQGAAPSATVPSRRLRTLAVVFPRWGGMSPVSDHAVHWTRQKIAVLPCQWTRTPILSAPCCSNLFTIHQTPPALPNLPSMSSPFLHRRYASSVLPHLPVVHTRIALCVPFPHTHARLPAGHLPLPPNGELITGKVGADLTVEEGAEAAKHVALNLLATLKHELGDLDRVVKVVKLVGFVNCTDGFAQQPTVINGCSDLIGEVFQERGVHARYEQRGWGV